MVRRVVFYTVKRVPVFSIRVGNVKRLIFNNSTRQYDIVFTKYYYNRVVNVARSCAFTVERVTIELRKKTKLFTFARNSIVGLKLKLKFYT